MSNLTYWERRQVNRLYDYMQSAEDTADQIAKLYQTASGYISNQLDKIFGRFRRKHNLSEAEARRVLSMLHDSTSLAELKAALEQSKDKDEIAKLLAELESPAYQARLERLRQLQNQLDQVMQNVYHQENLRSTSFYVDLANRAYYESIYQIQQRAGVAFDFSVIDPKVIDYAVGSSWSGANYSSRIWKNTDTLAKALKEELLVSLITGRTDRETAEIIANKFAAGASQARRLVRTESAYISGQMDMESYKECGIETYIFLATLDLRTSDTCRSLDKKPFEVSEQQPGVNCPPMHPWCRSTTICGISDEELARMQQRAIDPETGRAVKVPGNMTYQQWYDQYVKGKPGAELAEKKIRNRSSDRKQYEQYRKILDRDAPKTLDDFQEMKYNDSGKWEYTKGLKDYLKKYPTSDKRYYDIGQELKQAGITKNVVLPPVQKQAFILPDGKRDPYHIMHRMTERYITDDDIRSYMNDADVMLVQWGGKRQVFYGSKGVCVITKSEDQWIYKTAWKKEDFDESTEKILEVIRKYVK